MSESRLDTGRQDVEPLCGNQNQEAPLQLSTTAPSIAKKHKGARLSPHPVEMILIKTKSFGLQPIKPPTVLFVYEGPVCHGCKQLQTCMRGAFGKPQGTVVRVHIGQVIMSIRTKLQNKEHVIEALHRTKFRFPGRQKIHISKKWGFTKFNADEFEDMMAEKRLIPDGCGVKYIPNHGPLDKWRALHS
ncbi:60S ribosomal protein L10-like [Neovison vison]|uniref:60S ribosomal protein L10-like n=1 Tax=Neovison vison TaxID=452646 RepID=UPI001CF0AD66|nr:60S ribosomal protein L10-like [Neogale vison]